MRRGQRGAWSVVVMLALSQLLLAGDCVDGVTPDCSDAAAHCAPDLDGSVADVVDAGKDGPGD
jgi:hypothetical protein